MDQATYDDVNLILKLYELRREDKLRHARAWFAKFKAGTMAEFSAACPSGSDQEVYFRMVLSYWDMAASFVTRGVLNQELFLDSGAELLYAWEKIRDIVPLMRESYKNPLFAAHLEKVANAAIKRLDKANPEAYQAFSERARA